MPTLTPKWGWIKWGLTPFVLRKRAIKWGLTPFVLSVAVGAQAAREPVLKDVTLPHAYYWRELYS